MSTKINWDGTVTQFPSQRDFWSSTGGTFKGASGESTYFPLPMAYRSTIPTVGYYTVPIKYEHRADLIAKELYSTEDLWWLVYWASGITDPFKLVTGTSIRVVDLIELKRLLA